MDFRYESRRVPEYLLIEAGVHATRADAEVSVARYQRRKGYRTKVLTRTIRADNVEYTVFCASAWMRMRKEN